MASLFFFFLLLISLSPPPAHSLSSSVSPLTPKSYLFRYWNRKITNNNHHLPQPPLFFTSKLSPLSPLELATFSSLAPSNLSSHLPSFCSAARLLCSASLSSSPASPSPSHFAVYKNSNFSNYATGSRFPNTSIANPPVNNSFSTYSAGGYATSDSFRRYSHLTISDNDTFTSYSRGAELPATQFASYNSRSVINTGNFTSYDAGATDPDLTFTSYDINADQNLREFASYAEAAAGSGNESFTSYGLAEFVNTSFARYAGGSAAIASDFSSYGKKALQDADNFTSYGLHAADPTLTFTSYDANGDVPQRAFSSYTEGSVNGSESFSSYEKNANYAPAIFARYSDDADVGDAKFNNYGTNGFGAENNFTSYGENTELPDIEFKNYGEKSGTQNSFTTYRKGSAIGGDDRFISYGQKADFEVDSFTGYGDKSAKGSDSFNKYGDNETLGLFNFTSYESSATEFRGYQNVKPWPGGNQMTFTSYKNASTVPKSDAKVPLTAKVAFLTAKLSTKAAHLRGVESGKFFRERELTKGTVMPMPDIRDKTPARSFLPRAIAGKIPFSASEVMSIFQIPAETAMARAVSSTIGDCERTPSRGETKRCATSAEDMVDFAVSVLGPNVVVRTTENTNGSRGYILIGDVKGVNGGKVTESVSCHQSLFPYLVYYCHSVPKVRVYEADILDVSTEEKINRGVAICHLDTSDWSAGHGAFVALGSSPGQIEVCHWIFEGDMTWAVAD